ncbi:STAS domain-containing protein [Paractinoplanes rhizophilus]|uniref:STAS domain-containing protein n=1 Tax=Paractinoplanes rhizophilus TaxID=1416877 RepID=A0ABW2HTY2_9ACTN|nr:STAS domain-containing protein [Actinoplanes sp.]
MPGHEIPEAVVVVTESFDGVSVPQWGRLIAEAVELRPRCLIVDLRDSPLVDAAAIEVLLKAHRDMISGGGRLVLRAPSPRVRRILRLARLEQVFEVDDDLPARPAPAVPSVAN